MKTAISVADALYERGERFARRRSLSRSELYARALREYLDRHEGENITAQLDELYAEEDSRLDTGTAELGFEVLRRQERLD